MKTQIAAFGVSLIFLVSTLSHASSIVVEWIGTAESDGAAMSGGFEIDLSEQGVFYIDDFPVTSLEIDEFEISETDYKEYSVDRIWYDLGEGRIDPSPPSTLQIRNQVENHGFARGDFFVISNRDYIFSLDDPGDHTESPLLSSHDVPRSISDFDLEGFDFDVFSSVRVGAVDGRVTEFNLRLVPEPAAFAIVVGCFLSCLGVLRQRSGGSLATDAFQS